MIHRNAFKFLAVGVVGLALASCRTSSSDTSSTESAPPGAVGMPMLPILDIEGDTAEGIYNSLQIKEISTGLNAYKQRNGRLAAYCRFEATSKKCSVRSMMPRGTMGFPPPPFLVLEGDDAAAFSKAFRAPLKKQAGGYSDQAYETDSGTLRCDKTHVSSHMPEGTKGTPAQSPYIYRCVMK